MKQIRILLAGMPALLLDILHHVVVSEADMAVVGQIENGDLLMPPSLSISRWLIETWC